MPHRDKNYGKAPTMSNTDEKEIHAAIKMYFDNPVWLESRYSDLNLNFLANDAFTPKQIGLLVDIAYAFETGAEALKIDHLLATKIYGYCASKDNETAMNNLGWALVNGNGTEKDIKKAVSVFEAAAALGQTTAMVNLGNIHQDLDYEPNRNPEYADNKKATAWYKKAWEAGNDKGAFNYANMLHHGAGVRKNYKKAFEIFKTLSDKNYVDSYFYMGLYYENGYGVTKDYSQARRYYLLGADCNDRFCYTNLGRMYGLGIGVAKNIRIALKYYRAAWKLGDALAATNIGWCYETGDGIKADLAKALFWYRRAAALGEQRALKRLKESGFI
jgi:TPR repeat protein